MRVLTIPGPTHENLYFQLFGSSLERTGVKLITIRDKAALYFAFDVLHVHFPTHFITESTPVKAFLWACVQTTFFLLCRLFRKPIVYTVHDVLPFNIRNTWILRPYLQIFHRLCSAYIFLSSSSREEFLLLFPSANAKPLVQSSHGPYPRKLKTPEDSLQARQRLTIEDSEELLVGFLGQIKPYKNLSILPAIPHKLQNGREVKILVAGRIIPAFQEEGNRVLSQIPGDRIIRIDKRLTDDELDDLIKACDVVFLPYEKGWNSGAAMLALSNGTMVLGSDLPIFRELEEALPDWCSTFALRSDLRTESLAAALTRISEAKSGPLEYEQLSSFLDARSFTQSALQLKLFYEQLRANSGALQEQHSGASSNSFD